MRMSPHPCYYIEGARARCGCLPREVHHKQVSRVDTTRSVARGAWLRRRAHNAAQTSSSKYAHNSTKNVSTKTMPWNWTHHQDVMGARSSPHLFFRQCGIHGSRNALTCTHGSQCTHLYPRPPCLPFKPKDVHALFWQFLCLHGEVSSLRTPMVGEIRGPKASAALHLTCIFLYACAVSTVFDTEWDAALWDARLPSAPYHLALAMRTHSRAPGNFHIFLVSRPEYLQPPLSPLALQRHPYHRLQAYPVMLVPKAGCSPL